MRIHVECDSPSVPLGPQRFVLGDRTIEVEGLLDRWYGSEVDYFRVRDEEGHLYVLKHVRGYDCWELTSFTDRRSCGTSLDVDEPRMLH